MVTRARYGQLLLFVALLFGIATMHTMGHPSSGSGHRSGHGPGPEPVAVPHAKHLTPGAEPAEPAQPATVSLGGAAVHAPEASAVREPAGSPVRGHEGMDPASVCLAVLGTWGVALLVVRLMRRHPADRSLAAARAGLPHALRPNPPPPRTTLARLSVLRI
jgi:hypothetical protein